MQSQGGLSGGNKAKGKYDSIINSVAFVPDTFDDKKKNIGHFCKWREDMHVILNIYFDDIETILDHIRGQSRKIDQQVFNEICANTGYTPKWSFADAKKDIAIYVTKKLAETAVT